MPYLLLLRHNLHWNERLTAIVLCKFIFLQLSCVNKVTYKVSWGQVMGKLSTHHIRDNKILYSYLYTILVLFWKYIKWCMRSNWPSFVILNVHVRSNRVKCCQLSIMNIEPTYKHTILYLDMKAWKYDMTSILPNLRHHIESSSLTTRPVYIFGHVLL